MNCCFNHKKHIWLTCMSVMFNIVKNFKKSSWPLFCSVTLGQKTCGGLVPLLSGMLRDELPMHSTMGRYPIASGMCFEFSQDQDWCKIWNLKWPNSLNWSFTSLYHTWVHFDMYKSQFMSFTSMQKGKLWLIPSANRCTSNFSSSIPLRFFSWSFNHTWDGMGPVEGVRLFWLGESSACNVQIWPATTALWPGLIGHVVLTVW